MNIKDIIANKQAIIAEKKAIPKHGDVCLIETPITANKAGYLYENDEEAGTLKRTIVANTYNWLDSHGDVHLSGLFSKSIQERGTKIPHLHDHKFELSARVGRAMKVYEDGISWIDLGIKMKGTTTALFLESQIEKELNATVFKEYLKNQIDQHSVSMQYVKMDLAVNDEDYEEEYKVWTSVIDQIGNKEEAIKQGYFWAIREAKLIEISAVLLGSNTLTPTLNEPEKSTQIEPKRIPFDINKLLNYYKIQ